MFFETNLGGGGGSHITDGTVTPVNANFTVTVPKTYGTPKIVLFYCNQTNNTIGVFEIWHPEELGEGKYMYAATDGYIKIVNGTSNLPYYIKSITEYSDRMEFVFNAFTTASWRGPLNWYAIF